MRKATLDELDQREKISTMFNGTERDHLSRKCSYSDWLQNWKEQGDQSVRWGNRGGVLCSVRWGALVANLGNLECLFFLRTSTHYCPTTVLQHSGAPQLNDNLWEISLKTPCPPVWESSAGFQGELRSQPYEPPHLSNAALQFVQLTTVGWQQRPDSVRELRM